MSAKHEIPDGIIGRMGGKELVFGEHLVTLPDANSILDNPDAMRRRLADEAFLFFRGLHDPKLVARARREVLQEIDRQGGIAPGGLWAQTFKEDSLIARPDQPHRVISDRTSAGPVPSRHVERHPVRCGNGKDS